MMKFKKLIEIGWEEWIALPELNLPAIRAKIDTGAKTSALHAFMVEKFVDDGIEKVKFGIHPVPERPEIEVYSVARLVDEREVTSSNGQTELRYVIQVMAQFGKEKWPIEITLTNRETMNYRMLIGRSAMEGKVLVVPEQSFLLGSLSAELYESIKTYKHDRALKICILSKAPNNYSTTRIATVAESKGYQVDIINPEKCYAQVGSYEQGVSYQGRLLSAYDVIIPQIGEAITTHGLAIIRQLECFGSYGINTAEAISNARDKLLVQQLLSRGNISIPITAYGNAPSNIDDLIKVVHEAPLIIKSFNNAHVASSILVETNKAAHAAIQVFSNLKTNFIVQEYIAQDMCKLIRCIVLGGKVIAAIDTTQEATNFKMIDGKIKYKKILKLTAEERKIAVRAVRILGLKYASVELLRTSDRCLVMDISTAIAFKKTEEFSKKDIASILIEYIEHHARPTVSNISLSK